MHDYPITAPANGIIEELPYHFGQAVKKNDMVVTFNSMELQKQFNETLTDYLKAKDSFTVAKAKFSGTQELWNAGLLSKNNYLSEKSGLDTARVSLMQTTRKLSEMLEKVDDNKQDLSDLSIAEFEKVRQALTSKHNLIHLKAPCNGILLHPPKTTDDKTGRITVGASVKAGQIITLIGDMSGLSVEIDVPEVDILKIHPGMKANITGVALGKQVLHGQLTAVNAQANSANGSSLPIFSALVEVKNIPQSVRPLVRVGMSAAIEIKVEVSKQLLVPIAAVKQEKNNTVVMVREKNNVLTKRQVVTDAAEADKVAIVSGLKAGDVVVYGGQ